MNEKINRYFEYIYDNDCSDLHLKANNKPCARKNGVLQYFDEELVTNDDVLYIGKKYSITPIDENNESASYDFSFQYRDVRFRANLYRDINGYNVSLRLLRLFSTDFDVLGLPENLKKLVKKPNGLILLTGPTGSGKSTTLAALVNYLNSTERKHIITLEEPIEYVFESNMSLITQREVGKDTASFSKSISEAMRQDPDVLIIGEMRDKESIEAALVAAETGHLVLSTLHTRNAASTITRIIDMFESEKQNQILSQLSMSLIGILSQQLVKSADETRRYLATEFLVANIGVRNNIKSNKISMINSMISLGKQEGMYLMRDSLDKLLAEGKISQETYDIVNVDTKFSN